MLTRSEFYSRVHSINKTQQLATGRLQFWECAEASSKSPKRPKGFKPRACQVLIYDTHGEFIVDIIIIYLVAVVDVHCCMTNGYCLYCIP